MLILCEATAAVEEMLKQPSRFREDEAEIAGKGGSKDPQSRLKARTAFEHMVVRQNVGTGVLVAAREERGPFAAAIVSCGVPPRSGWRRG